MRETLTYARTVELLLKCGAPVEEVEALIKKAIVVAGDRHSQVLGGRHLMIAAGIAWSDRRHQASLVAGDEAE